MKKCGSSLYVRNQLHSVLDKLVAFILCTSMSYVMPNTIVHRCKLKILFGNIEVNCLFWIHRELSSK
jgi:hypothetical protein